MIQYIYYYRLVHKRKLNRHGSKIIEKSLKIRPKNLRDRGFFVYFIQKCSFSVFGVFSFGGNNNLKFEGHGVAQVEQHHSVQVDHELLDVGLQLGGLTDVHGLQRLIHDVPEVVNSVY
jgi:hypothetical protein